jgi:hypothetical protein
MKIRHPIRSKTAGESFKIHRGQRSRGDTRNNGNRRWVVRDRYLQFLHHRSAEAPSFVAYGLTLPASAGARQSPHCLYNRRVQIFSLIYRKPVIGFVHVSALRVSERRPRLGTTALGNSCVCILRLHVMPQTGPAKTRLASHPTSEHRQRGMCGDASGIEGRGVLIYLRS